jgi:hypothetical protein
MLLKEMKFIIICRITGNDVLVSFSIPSLRMKGICDITDPVYGHEWNTCVNNAVNCIIQILII